MVKCTTLLPCYEIVLYIDPNIRGHYKSMVFKVKKYPWCNNVLQMYRNKCRCWETLKSVHPQFLMYYGIYCVTASSNNLQLKMNYKEPFGTYKPDKHMAWIYVYSTNGIYICSKRTWSQSFSFGYVFWKHHVLTKRLIPSSTEHENGPEEFSSSLLCLVCCYLHSTRNVQKDNIPGEARINGQKKKNESSDAGGSC